MWNSPWSSVPCCCGIRFAELRSGSRQYIFSVDRHEDCRGPNIADQKLLLLGLTIAELLIGTSLRLPRVIDQRSSGVFILDRWDAMANPPKWVKKSRLGILDDIRAIPDGDPLADAVNFCLDNAEIGFNKSLNPDSMRRVVEHVVEP